MILFTTFLAFLAILFALLGIFKMMESVIILPRKRMKLYTGQIAAAIEDTEKPKRQKENFKNFLKPLSVLTKKMHFSRKWEDKLIKADIPLKGEEFLAMWIIGVGIMLFLSMLNVKFFVSLALVVISPPFLLARKIAKRAKKFDTQLNDALNIMANSMRAGFSFFQAMDTVRKEMPDPISKEFTRTLKEINFGTPVEEALGNMARRVGSADLDLMITAVLIQRQVGGNMAEILDTISQTIRDRIKILGEIKTLTAQGRMSGYIIGSLPVIIAGVLFLINPSYISVLFTNRIGWGIIAGGIISEIFGIILIKKVISIEV